MRLSVRADIRKAIRGLRLTPREVGVAARRALNVAGRRSKVELSRVIAKESGLKVGQVKRDIRLRAPKGSNLGTLSTSMRSTRRPMPLSSFTATRKGKAGAKSRAWGELKTYKHTFIAKMASGHVGVFTRAKVDGDKRVGRLPIKELYGPEIPKTMADQKVGGVVLEFGRKVFDKEFRRLIQLGRLVP